MAPFVTHEAKTNLQKGIKKMEASMTKAAKVRRDFRMGRPPKAGDGPLHPIVVWRRAVAALANFRERMAAAGLDPFHAEAVIVYVETSASTTPLFIPIESLTKTPAQLQAEALEKLQGDTFALGMVFTQGDTEAGDPMQQVFFPYQLTGLSEVAVAVMRLAAKIKQEEVRIVNGSSS